MMFGSNTPRVAFYRKGVPREFQSDLEIKDVCKDCNSDLSPYDDAGAAFVQAINAQPSMVGQSLAFDRGTLIWLIKTHLNALRIDKGKSLSLDQSIYQSLFGGTFALAGKCRLFVEAWDTIGYERRRPGGLSGLAYGTFDPPQHGFVVSYFRMMWLGTYLFLPTDGDYTDFVSRSLCTVAKLDEMIAFEAQEVDSVTDMASDRIDVKTIVPPLRGVDAKDVWFSLRLGAAGGTRLRILGVFA